MKKIILLLLVVNAIVFGGYGQAHVFHLFKTNEEIGDEYFHQFSYVKALDAYSEAIKEPSDLKRAGLKLKMAEAYRMLNDPQNSAIWYESGLVIETTNPTYLLHYAEALSSLKRYEEAKKWYKKYDEQAGHDGRGSDKIARIDSRDELFKNASRVTINEVGFNSEFADFSPIIHKNEVYFVSARPSEKVTSLTYSWDDSDFLDIYIIDSSKNISRFHKDINTRYHEGPLAFYDGGKQMLFTRNNYRKGLLQKSEEGISKLKLYSCELLNNGDWSNPVELHFNNDEYSVGHPTVSSNGETLYFISDMPNGHGGTDIYKVIKNETGEWSTPELLGDNVNTEGNEMFPFLHNDRYLYFASNGLGGLGGLDLFVIDLDKGNNAQPFNIGSPVNTSFDDFGIVLTTDGLSGYLSSNRKDSRQNDDIYSFTTTVPFVNRYMITGIVYNKQTKEVLPNATIKVTLEDGSTQVITADSTGYYAMEANPDEKYNINASKDEFIDKSAQVEIVEGAETELKQDFYLNRDFDFTLYGVIADHKTDEPLDSVHITIRNVIKKSYLDHITSKTGDFEQEIVGAEIGDNVHFELKIERKGYLAKTVDFKAVLDKPGRINLNEVLNVKLDKIDVGTDLGKLIDLKPIYFDLGKSIIRPDAAHELDKIVAIMNDNQTMVIELGSHTDSRGSAKFNLSLSDKRAKASAQYIVSQGIDTSRIVGKGYGEEELINKCADGVKCSKDEHQLNRRTEFKIVKF